MSPRRGYTIIISTMIIKYIKKSQPRRRFYALFAVVMLACRLFIPVNLSYAQTVLSLPEPGSRVSLSSEYVPVLLKGLKLYPNPFQFDFIMDTGHSELEGAELRQESTTLIKYFLAALTIPEKELWVNLSPFEKERIIPESFGATEMGRDLLAQDYLLKQLTASLMNPEEDLGQKFWDRIYQKAFELYGTTSIPVNTFNKIWIIPEEALVYSENDAVFIIKGRLKVLLEQDYLAMQEVVDSSIGIALKIQNKQDPVTKKLHEDTVDIVRDLIVPEIEKEVNEGKNFAKLRQIFHAVILAKWYKQNLQENILNKKYADQRKTDGVEVDDKEIKDKIYQQYLAAFRKGVYNLIKEDYDPNERKMVPRKYFLGGSSMIVTLKETKNSASLQEAENIRLIRVSSAVGLPNGIVAEAGRSLVSSPVDGPPAELRPFGDKVSEEELKLSAFLRDMYGVLSGMAAQVEEFVSVTQKAELLPKTFEDFDARLSDAWTKMMTRIGQLLNDDGIKYDIFIKNAVTHRFQYSRLMESLTGYKGLYKDGKISGDRAAFIQALADVQDTLALLKIQVQNLGTELHEGRFSKTSAGRIQQVQVVLDELQKGQAYVDDVKALLAAMNKNLRLLENLLNQQTPLWSSIQNLKQQIETQQHQLVELGETLDAAALSEGFYIYQPDVDLARRFDLLDGAMRKLSETLEKRESFNPIFARYSLQSMRGTLVILAGDNAVLEQKIQSSMEWFLKKGEGSPVSSPVPEEPPAADAARITETLVTFFISKSRGFLDILRSETGRLTQWGDTRPFPKTLQEIYQRIDMYYEEIFLAEIEILRDSTVGGNRKLVDGINELELLIFSARAQLDKWKDEAVSVRTVDAGLLQERRTILENEISGFEEALSQFEADFKLGVYTADAENQERPAALMTGFLEQAKQTLTEFETILTRLRRDVQETVMLESAKVSEYRRLQTAYKMLDRMKEELIAHDAMKSFGEARELLGSINFDALAFYLMAMNRPFFHPLTMEPEEQNRKIVEGAGRILEEIPPLRRQVLQLEQEVREGLLEKSGREQPSSPIEPPGTSAGLSGERDAVLSIIPEAAQGRAEIADYILKEFGAEWKVAFSMIGKHLLDRSRWPFISRLRAEGFPIEVMSDLLYSRSDLFIVPLENFPEEYVDFILQHSKSRRGFHRGQFRDIWAFYSLLQERQGNPVEGIFAKMAQQTLKREGNIHRQIMKEILGETDLPGPDMSLKKYIETALTRLNQYVMQGTVDYVWAWRYVGFFRMGRMKTPHRFITIPSVTSLDAGQAKQVSFSVSNARGVYGLDESLNIWVSDQELIRALTPYIGKDDRPREPDDPILLGSIGYNFAADESGARAVRVKFSQPWLRLNDRMPAELRNNGLLRSAQAVLEEALEIYLKEQGVRKIQREIGATTIDQVEDAVLIHRNTVQRLNQNMMDRGYQLTLSRYGRNPLAFGKRLALWEFEKDLQPESSGEVSSPVTAADAPGGIDLNPSYLNLRTEGGVIDIPVFQNTDQLMNINIQGLTPYILNITPIQNLPLILGAERKKDSGLLSRL